MFILNLANIVNNVNIVNVANIVDFNAMRYKKEYNDLPQVLVSRQTSNSIERDNFSAMYVSFEQFRLDL